MGLNLSTAELYVYLYVGLHMYICGVYPLFDIKYMNIADITMEKTLTPERKLYQQLFFP